MNKRVNQTLSFLQDGTLFKRLELKGRREIAKRRKAWWTSQIGKQDELDYHLQRDLQIRLYFDSQLSRLIYAHDFEWQEREFLRLFLRRGDIFVDVGANIGLYTLLASRLVGSEGHVYSFEPHFETYERLVKNIELNHLKNVSNFQIALSDQEKELDMAISLDGYDAWNSFSKPTAGNSFELRRVNATTWDRFCQAHSLTGRVTMMKIDVEGWEAHVLAGGKANLSQKEAPILLVEFNERPRTEENSSALSLYRAIETFGYRLFVYDGIKRRLVGDPLDKKFSSWNLVAVKDQSHIMDRLGVQSLI